jgi:hypothetical protein
MRVANRYSSKLVETHLRKMMLLSDGYDSVDGRARALPLRASTSWSAKLQLGKASIAACRSTHAELELGAPRFTGIRRMPTRAAIPHSRVPSPDNRKNHWTRKISRSHLDLRIHASA